MIKCISLDMKRMFTAMRKSLQKEKKQSVTGQRDAQHENGETDIHDVHIQKLQFALNEISSLVRLAEDNHGYSTGCINPDINPLGKNGTFAREPADPITRISEHFNSMMNILEKKNRELEKAYTELRNSQSKILQQEKMASIGQLAAGVAHEINNPIGFISSNLGTLDTYVHRIVEFIDVQNEIFAPVKSDEMSAAIHTARKRLKLDYIVKDVEDLIHESLEGAGRVRQIVNNLKSFSRIDEAEYKSADINQCLESTLNIVWNELKYKTTITREYGEIPLTRCYPQQLNQVFMNLLVNAAHAIEKQGEICIRTWNGDGSINIAISDTGQGIPQDSIDKIFEPFYTTKEAGKGTGLGLSISYDIVKKHYGEISVESRVGEGTAFTIRIPVVTEESGEGHGGNGR